MERHADDHCRNAVRGNDRRKRQRKQCVTQIGMVFLQTPLVVGIELLHNCLQHYRKGMKPAAIVRTGTETWYLRSDRSPRAPARNKAKHE